MTEEWRPVAEWPYEVSDLGRVRRSVAAQRTHAGRVVSAKSGRYPVVILTDKGRRKGFHVHALVAGAFLGPRPGRCQINHKDGDKHNNRPANLEYVTADANMAHAKKSGLILARAAHPRAKLTEDNVATIRRLYASGVSQADIARQIGRHPATINHVVRGRHWREPGVIG
jgi:hypothetical protein